MTAKYPPCTSPKYVAAVMQELIGHAAAHRSQAHGNIGAALGNAILCITALSKELEKFRAALAEAGEADAPQSSPEER